MRAFLTVFYPLMFPAAGMHTRGQVLRLEGVPSLQWVRDHADELAQQQRRPPGCLPYCALQVEAFDTAGAALAWAWALDDAAQQGRPVFSVDSRQCITPAWG